MGTGRRDNKKLFISRAHAAVAGSDNPTGPGQYAPNVDASSKYRSPGGSSFGRSKRPGMATVKF
jgi:hypothetical protein